jgi:hypothetical protein
VFTLVNEPPDGSDCADVGSAVVSLADILKTKKDLVRDRIPKRESFCHIHSSYIIQTSAVFLEMCG